MIFEEYRKSILDIDISDYSSLLNIGRKLKKIVADRYYDVSIGIIGSASLQLTDLVM